MTSDHLTAILAERVMGWGVGPDRFMMGNRVWKPRWKFQPAEKLQDAIRLLDAANPDFYNLDSKRGGACTAQVHIGEMVGVATESSQARALTHAIARAIGVEPKDGKVAKTGVDLR